MDDTAFECYRYRKLKPDKHDIRLLQIEDASGGADSTIVCQLCHRKVSELRDVYINEGAWKKPYETLSYSWGPTSPNGSHLTDMIICDGLPLRVTATLNQGLKRYRESRDQRYRGSRPCEFLWVDAICINQSDAEDRNTQVRRMDVIYQSSQCTIIWLGELWSSEAGEVIKQWSKKAQLHGGPMLDDSTVARAEAATLLQTFLTLPWFSRRWTVQEYALPSAKTFLLGPLCIKPSWVHESLQELKIEQGIEIFRHGYFVLNQANFAKEQTHTPSASDDSLDRSLLARLHHFGNTAYSDPRDSISALHGISVDRHSFIVDYSKPLRQTHLAVADFYTKNRLTFLPYLVSTMRYQRNAAYPSWLVDWSQPQSTDAKRLSTYNTLYETASSRRTGITARSWSKFAPEIGIDARLSIRAVLLQTNDLTHNSLPRRVCYQRLQRGLDTDLEGSKKKYLLDSAVCLLKHTKVAFGLHRKKTAAEYDVYELMEVLHAPEANEKWWEEVLEDHIETKVVLA